MLCLQEERAFAAVRRSEEDQACEARPWGFLDKQDVAVGGISIKGAGTTASLFCVYFLQCSWGRDILKFFHFELIGVSDDFPRGDSF